VPAARVPHLTPTLSAPKVGEGDFQLSAYGFQHAPNVFHDITVPESDYPIAAPRNLPGSNLINFSAISMLSAVEFNDELCLRAGEIHDVSPDRVLPTEAVGKPEVAQLPPQPPLGLRHIPPQPPREDRSPSDDHSISIRTAPYSTGCASATRICATRPGRCARIWFITFIASMISSGCPSATESPRRTKGGSPGCGAR
jgi:hypothetical protein